ncbi:zf-HC2 domain-containing protein [Halomonas organivorans]
MSDQDRSWEVQAVKEHATWLECVAPYLDGELNARERQEMTRHLDTCPLCQRELERQRAVACRLEALKPTAESSAAMERRLRRRLLGTPSRRPPRRPWWGWLGWGLALAQACLLVTLWLPSWSARDGVPMVDDAVADYRHVLADRLPPRSTMDTDALSRALSLSIEPLQAPDVTFLGGWETVLQEQPAAALAYRVKEQVVVQYVVTEPLFFNQASVRDAVARQGHYITRQGRQGIVGWPDSNAGSLLVGELPTEELVRLRL